MNFRYTTAAFTLSPESGVSSCGADLPGDWALYAIYSPRPVARPSGRLKPVKIISPEDFACPPACALHADRSAHGFALRVAASFGRSRFSARLPLRSSPPDLPSRKRPCLRLTVCAKLC